MRATDTDTRQDAQPIPCDYCQARDATCAGQYEDEDDTTFACAECCDSPNSEHNCTPIRAEAVPS